MSSSNTDFDATLVDWLYGELDSDAMASFEAHLETHPEHKAEAFALKDTRMAFRELPQAEPSHALTAVLMQQAAASAQPTQGVWASIVGFFQPVLMHPAAAAMATVVLLAGVAGTLYLRNGNMVAEPSVASSKAERPSAPEAAPAFADEAKNDGLAQNAPETFAGAEDSEADPNADDYRNVTADIASPVQEEVLRAAMEREDQRAQKQSRGAVAKDRSRIETSKVSKNQKSSVPGKLLDSDSLDRFNSTSNAISGGAVTGYIANEKGLARVEESPNSSNRSGASSKSLGAVKKPKAKPSTTNKPQTWASQQVADFQSAARGKRCRDAGRIANDLKEKSPQDYKKSVEGSPEETGCSYSIATETKRRKTARSKQAKKRQGQGKSVPKKAVAAPQEADAVGEGL